LPEGVRPVIRGRDFTVASIAAAAGVKEEMRAALEAAAAAPGAEAKPAAGTEAKPAAGKPAAGKPEAAKKG
jgi:large subunit ribosomal protein L25